MNKQHPSSLKKTGIRHPCLIKKGDSCPIPTSPDSQSDLFPVLDIRLSALVDNITISINVQ